MSNNTIEIQTNNNKHFEIQTFEIQTNNKAFKIQTNNAKHFFLVNPAPKQAEAQHLELLISKCASHPKNFINLIDKIIVKAHEKKELSPEVLSRLKLMINIGQLVFSPPQERSIVNTSSLKSFISKCAIDSKKTINFISDVVIKAHQERKLSQNKLKGLELIANVGKLAIESQFVQSTMQSTIYRIYCQIENVKNNKQKRDDAVNDIFRLIDNAVGFIGIKSVIETTK